MMMMIADHGASAFGSSSTPFLQPVTVVVYSQSDEKVTFVFLSRELGGGDRPRALSLYSIVCVLYYVPVTVAMCRTWAAPVAYY